MIYLKTFENYQDYYTIITDDSERMRMLTSISNKIDIDSKVKDIIESRNTNGDITIRLKSKSSGFPFKEVPRMIELDQILRVSGEMPIGEEHKALERFINMNIYELVDEWFIVTCKVAYRPKSHWNTPKDTTTYYKCDQLEGLLKLLEDLNIIK